MSEPISEPVIEWPRMRGDALMAVGAGEFDVPIFSHIVGNLWTGCSPAEFPEEYDGFHGTAVWIPFKQPVTCSWLMDGNKSRFEAILNLFPWCEYIIPAGVDYRAQELHDEEEVAAADLIDDLAEWVHKRAYVEDKITLVHCQAGLNRSALIAGRSLMIAGYSSDEAIQLIREKRSPTALCNESFEAYLRSLDE